MIVEQNPQFFHTYLFDEMTFKSNGCINRHALLIKREPYWRQIANRHGWSVNV